MHKADLFLSQIRESGIKQGGKRENVSHPLANFSTDFNWFSESTATINNQVKRQRE